MSLILDALRKLDRERDAREPGVVVVGTVPWGRPQRSRRPMGLALLAVGLVALAAGGWWLLRPNPRPTAFPAPPTAAPGVAAPAAAPAQRPSQVPLALSPPAAPAAAEAAPPPRRVPLPAPTRGPESPAADASVPTEGSPIAAAPAPARPGDLRLQAIAERDGRPVALINDRLVREGDSFEGVTVLRIGTAEVEIEVRGQRRVLRF